jgi:hypothetical protein
MALASATPPSRSSRHRLRSVFGEHSTIADFPVEGTGFELVVRGRVRLVV